MNLRRIVCWLWSHSWEVVEGKRHCTVCDLRPEDEGVMFCPKCGSERLMGHIMASWGYQYTSCKDCEHKFQDTHDGAVTVVFGDYSGELEKPLVNQDGYPVDQDGNLIMEEEEE